MKERWTGAWEKSNYSYFVLHESIHANKIQMAAPNTTCTYITGPLTNNFRLPVVSMMFNPFDTLFISTSLPDLSLVWIVFDRESMGVTAFMISWVGTPFKKAMLVVQLISYVLIVGSPFIGGFIGRSLGFKVSQTGGSVPGISIQRWLGPDLQVIHWNRISSLERFIRFIEPWKT